jgi:hypothetical protein
MESVVGIFSDRATAESVIQQVLASGVPQNSIVYLCGEQGAAEVEALQPLTPSGTAWARPWARTWAR